MSLLDANGRPLKKQELLEEEGGPSVTGVRQVISEHPSVGLTPIRLAHLLMAAEEGDPSAYLALAEDMEEKDLHYRSVLSTRKRAVSQLDITVVPAGDDKQSQDDAALIEEWLSRDALEDELFDMLDAIGKGFSCTEIIWETSGKLWLPERLEWRDPRWFDFDPADGKTLRLLTDEGAQPLTPYKWVPCLIKSKSGLPIRAGLARAAAWAYLFKNFDIKAWVTFAEVYGQPLRVGKYHQGATESDKRTLLRAVSSIGTDAAAIIPQSMAVDFIKSEVGSASMYKELAEFMDHQMSKAVLGQTTTTDAISGGHAVSKEHNDVRSDIERSDAKQLAACLNTYLVRPIIDLNKGAQKRYPRIQIGRPDPEDIDQLTRSLQRLVPLGLRVSETQVRSKLSLKAPEEGEDILRIPSKEPVPPIKGLAKATLSTQPEPEEADAMDDMVLEMLGDFEPDMAGIVNPVFKAADESDDFETFRAKLTASIKQMDTDALADRLARAAFNGRMAGNVGAPVSEEEDAG